MAEYTAFHFDCFRCIDGATKSESANSTPILAFKTGATPTPWKAPTIFGLQLGRAKERDVRRILGKPYSEGSPEEKTFESKEGELELEYHRPKGFQGNIVIILEAKSKLLKALTLYPDRMSREDAVLKYGRAQYEISSADPICEKPQRPPQSLPASKRYPIALVYPSRGMVIFLDRNDAVNHIDLLYSCARL